MADELRSVRYKPKPGIAPGHRGGFAWRRASLLDFLLAVPAWEMALGLDPTEPNDWEAPSLAAFNALFAKGRVCAGMSGGCELKPFEIDLDECELLIELLLTDPRIGVTKAWT